MKRKKTTLFVVADSSDTVLEVKGKIQGLIQEVMRRPCQEKHPFCQPVMHCFVYRNLPLSLPHGKSATVPLRSDIGYRPNQPCGVFQAPENMRLFKDGAELKDDRRLVDSKVENDDELALTLKQGGVP